MQDNVPAEGTLHAHLVLAWTSQGMVGGAGGGQEDIQLGDGLVMAIVHSRRKQSIVVISNIPLENVRP